jgi:hypothetical protein
MAFRHPQPSNEDDFELFGLRLLRAVWGRPNLQLHGKRGERQDGIDLIDLSGSTPFRAAQCKHHEAGKTIPPKEIEGEVAKALKHDPPLDEYYILTTAKKARQAQKAVLKINQQHETEGKFLVVLWHWEEIEQCLDGLDEVTADEVLRGDTGRSLVNLQNVFARVFPRLPNLPGPSSEPDADTKSRAPKVWRPRVCYPLQPAPHFRGREKLRAELLAWARAPAAPDRVVSLVAVGGTGKTALAERVLADLGERPPAGVLVWSFYEDPRTEGFLRAACEYFTGVTPTSASGLLERLQTALAGDEPHLLVLDGLERVQAEGTTGRPRGEVEDPQLRRLLRWLAAGQGTRALVTSRFPLVDLDNWKGAGYREERLEDLEPSAAWAVLRGWGVKGDDATLDELAEPLHCHALSVAVLGSYLGKLWGGDPTKAPTFDREEEAAADPKAAKLNRILSSPGRCRATHPISSSLRCHCG